MSSRSQSSRSTSPSGPDLQPQTSCLEHVALSRRRLLGGGAAAAASLAMWGYLPKAVAGTRDPRLLVVILRGGLDGLALASPAGDPQLVSLRHKHAILAGGEGARGG